MADSSNDQKLIALDILAKFALVLSKTKDALIADLKEQLLENVSGENPDWEDIENLLENVFRLLGYNISALIPQEISDGADKLFKVSGKLATIVDGISELQESENFADIFSDDKGGDVLEKVLESSEALIESTVEMIKAFKKLSDMQLDGMQEQWVTFVKESNFEKDLPRRLFDHLLSVFMRNVGEVFAEDIQKLIDTVKEEANKLSGELKEEVLEMALSLEEIVKDFGKGFEEGLKTLFSELREQIKTLATILDEKRKQLTDEFVKELESLKKLLDLEEYFKRIYTILDFMQVISKERVQILPLPASAGNNEQPAILSTEIYVIHWSRFEEMAKNPIEYYKARYPVNNYADAEELMKRLIRVVQAFGLDIPDFDTLKSMLIDMLRKLEKWVKESINDAIGDDIRNLIEVVKNFLTMLERVAMEAKAKIEDEIGTILRDIRDEVKEIYSEIAKNAADINSVKTKIGNRVTDTTKDLIADIRLEPFPGKAAITDSLEKIVWPVIIQKVSEYKEFEKITEADWKLLLEETATGFLSVFTSIKTNITQFSERDFAVEIKDALLAELERQTEDIPTSMEELISKIKDNPNHLLPDKLLSKFDIYAYFNIIAAKIKEIAGVFNPEKYYDAFKSTATNALIAIVAKGNDTAARFKNSVENQDTELLKKTFNSFINNVLIECWKELRRELFDKLLTPYVNVIEAVVKGKGQTLLLDIMQEITEDVDEIKGLISDIPKEYKDFASEVFPIIYNATREGVDNWKDGVKLAINIGKPFYELIDAIIDRNYSTDEEKAKQKASKVATIPDLPEKKKSGKDNVDISTNVPSYSLDVDNKFLSIVLYDTRKKEKSANYFAATLNIFIADKKKSDDESQTGVYVVPMLRGNVEQAFDIGKKHELKLGFSAGLNATENEENTKVIEDFKKGAIGIFFTHKTFEWLDDTDAISACADLTFSRKEDAGKLEIIKSKYLDFSIGNYPQTISVGYKESDFYFKYKGDLKEGEFILKLSKINDFFAELMKEDVKAFFDLSLIYDTAEGFKFDGSASLKADFNLNKKIADVFTLNKLGVEIGPSDSKDSAIRALINTSFTIDTKAVVFYVKDLGIGADINYLKEDGSLGDFDFSPTFKFPSGMGVHIDASAVKGTGAISYNRDKEEFVGVLELVILEKVEVKALALLTMKMPDGGKGFSFVGIICAYFKPGIPLGMGFSLTGLGGALGLNRAIDRDTMQTGVRKGEIASVFFIENIEGHLDTMLTQLGSYFPIKRNQFFFGILARISYTEILNVDFGLLVQAPKPTQIIIVGGLFVNLPTKEKAIVKINVYFAGGIDFDEGMWFDASIVDSEIVKIQIYGDMAFRLYWGQHKGFLFSAGGFHPAYKPDAAFNLGVMKRLGMKLDYKILKLTFESYFAITSNTVQLGAQVDLKIGWDNVGIFGYFGFDCLFQFKPFHFIFDVRMGVEARWRSWTLLSIALEFALSGPAQWNAKGKAKFKILFFSCSISFDHTWGKKNSESEISHISVYGLISEEYFKIENWNTAASDIQDLQVRLAELNTEGEEGSKDKPKELIVQPFQSIQFEQPVLPLDETQPMQRFGEGMRPMDYSSIHIEKVEIGDTVFNNLTETEYDFAPSLFFDLTEQEKLSRPSYEKIKNGVKIETGLKERSVSTVSTQKINYLIEQDDITILAGATGYQIKEDGSNITKNLKKGPAPLPTENPLRNVVKRIQPIQNEISVIDAFTSIPHRSDSGFKRHINRMQQQQKEENTGKLNKLFEIMEKKYTFVVKDSLHSIETEELELVERRRYSKMEVAKSRLLRKRPELRNKLFIVQK